MKFDLNLVQFSTNDKLRKIRIPDEMSELLAEETGIHIGDGSLGIYKFPSTSMWLYRISGNREEYDYYRNHIQRILKILYNFPGNLHQMGNECEIKLYSKAVATFKRDVLMLPAGSKAKTVRIPEIVKNRKYIKYFIRGLADADFSISYKKKHYDVHRYPVIQARFSNSNLVQDLKNVLIKMGFTVNTYQEPWTDSNGKIQYLHTLYLSGSDSLNKWVKEIGFNNPVQKTKFLVWKRFNFCPPNTKLSERIQILNNSLDPLDFYKRHRSSIGRAIAS